MHAEGAHEIPLHEPERLGEQQRVGSLDRHPVHHVAPELGGKHGVEAGAVHAVLGPGGDAAVPGKREPEPLVVLLGEGHGRVEADDGKLARHVENGPDHRLAHLGDQVVELSGVVPGGGGPVVAVVDVAHPPLFPVHVLEDDRRVALVPVAVLDEEADASVAGEVRAGELVIGIGGVVELDEPVRMLQYPLGVEPGVVGDHVAGQTDAPLGAAPFQVIERPRTAQVVGDDVVVEGIGGGDGIRVARDVLDPLGGGRPLPDADQPESREAPAGEPVQFGVRYLVQGAHLGPVGLGELAEPDVDHLGDHHHVRHPVRVPGEALELGVVVPPGKPARPAAEAEHLGLARPAAGGEGALFLADDVHGGYQLGQQVTGQKGGPVFLDVGDLTGQGIGGGLDGGPQQLRQRKPDRLEAGSLGEAPVQLPGNGEVGRGGRQLGRVEDLPEIVQGAVFAGEPQQEQLGGQRPPPPHGGIIPGQVPLGALPVVHHLLRGE